MEQPARGWALTAITLAVMMAVLDTAIVNIALPAMSRDLAVEPSLAVWVVVIYQLAVTATLFPLAALGEKYGHERIYLGGIVLFTVSSLACALSPTLDILCLSRLFQGLGAAAIMSVNLALVRAIMPSARLGRGVAYNTLIVALSSTAGPSLGAVILSVGPWPLLFLVNLPIGIAAAVLAARFLPRTPRARFAFEGMGTVLNAAAVLALILAVDAVGRSRPAWIIAAQIALAIGLTALLVRHQWSRERPVLPLDLLRIPAIGLASLTAILSYVVQSLAFVSLPFHLHDLLRFTQADIGWAMTPWPIGVALSSQVAARLTERFSTAQISTTGLLMLSLGLICLYLMPSTASFADVAWRMALCGLGFGSFQVPNSKAIIATAPVARSGSASALQSTARLVGQSLGAALTAALFALSADQPTSLALAVASGFAVSAMVVSGTRLSLVKESRP